MCASDKTRRSSRGEQLDKWISETCQAIGALSAQVALLVEQNIRLRQRMNRLEEGVRCTESAIAKLSRGESDVDDEDAPVFNSDSSSSRKQENNKNIVISGIRAAADKTASRERIEQVLRAVGLSSQNVLNYRPIRATGRVDLVLVEFKETHHQRTALENARKLRRHEAFDGIYINEQQRQRERIADKKLRDRIRDLNLPLNGRDELGRPFGIVDDGTKKFFWIARNGQAKQVIRDL